MAEEKKLGPRGEQMRQLMLKLQEDMKDPVKRKQLEELGEGMEKAGLFILAGESMDD